jgi:hypothetical protein
MRPLLKTLLPFTVVLAATAAHAAAAHVELGSFLNRPASTTDQLVQQTRRDRQVLDRYERHFHMSERELVQMFSGLHPAKLGHSGSFTVYNVHDDNIIRARVFILKKGTPVFEDENGKPILKISCGNPLVAPRPKVVVVVTPNKPCPPVVIPPPAPVVEEKVTTIIMPPAPEAPPVVQPAAPVTNVYHEGSVVTNSKSSLFILPILLFINNHGHHENKTKQPVPEPASMLVMAIGAGALAIKRRRKGQ